MDTHSYVLEHEKIKINDSVFPDTIVVTNITALEKFMSVTIKLNSISKIEYIFIMIPLSIWNIFFQQNYKYNDIVEVKSTITSTAIIGPYEEFIDKNILYNYNYYSLIKHTQKISLIPYSTYTYKHVITTFYTAKISPMLLKAISHYYSNRK